MTVDSRSSYTQNQDISNQGIPNLNHTPVTQTTIPVTTVNNIDDQIISNTTNNVDEQSMPKIPDNIDENFDIYPPPVTALNINAETDSSLPSTVYCHMVHVQNN